MGASGWGVMTGIVAAAPAVVSNQARDTPAGLVDGGAGAAAAAAVTDAAEATGRVTEAPEEK